MRRDSIPMEIQQELFEQNKRQCYCCLRIKDLSDFNKLATDKQHGYQRRCKECSREYQKKRYNDNITITPEEREIMNFDNKYVVISFDLSQEDNELTKRLKRDHNDFAQVINNADPTIKQKICPIIYEFSELTKLILVLMKTNGDYADYMNDYWNIKTKIQRRIKPITE